mgnify:CR=1 FL=1
MSKLSSWEALTGTRATIESDRTIAAVAFPLKSAIQRITDTDNADVAENGLSDIVCGVGSKNGTTGKSSLIETAVVQVIGALWGGKIRFYRLFLNYFIAALYIDCPLLRIADLAACQIIKRLVLIGDVVHDVARPGIVELICQYPIVGVDVNPAVEKGGFMRPVFEIGECVALCDAGPILAFIGGSEDIDMLIDVACADTICDIGICRVEHHIICIPDFRFILKAFLTVGALPCLAAVG